MTAWYGFIGRNKLPKLLSLLLALALWFAVGGEERTEANLSIPLEFVNLAPDLTLSSDVPSVLQVRISGPRSLIRTLSKRPLVHSVDLSGYKAGPHTIALGPQIFPFPRGIEVSRVQPNPLNLTLSQTITRLLPVKPVLSGRPPTGYEVKEVSLRPDHVKVKGPADEISGLKDVATLPIDISNLSGSATLATDLDFKNLHLSLAKNISILADITIGPKMTLRRISGVPVQAIPHPARLFPTRVTAVLRGPVMQLQNLKPGDLKATVDTSDLKTGRRVLKVSLSLPAGLELHRLEPETVKALR